jgi:hypothetical protein
MMLDNCNKPQLTNHCEQRLTGLSHKCPQAATIHLYRHGSQFPRAQQKDFGNTEMKTLNKMKALLLAAVSLAFAGAAHAGLNISGTAGFVPFGTGGHYAASTVDFSDGSTFAAANFATGSFAGLVSTVFAANWTTAVSINSTTVTGIPLNTPGSISIANFITFGSGTGSTPQRFAFDLTSINTINPAGQAGAGSGILRDTLGTYNDATAEFSYSFSGPYNYSIAFVAIPEPSAYVAILGAMTLGIVAIRRRKQAEA